MADVADVIACDRQAPDSDTPSPAAAQPVTDSSLPIPVGWRLPDTGAAAVCCRCAAGPPGLAREGRRRAVPVLCCRTTPFADAAAIKSMSECS